MFAFPFEPVHQNVGQPLFLTEFIKKGEFEAAKNLSRVQGLDEDAAFGVESYAGFITLEELRWQSQLFFWFFPAEGDEPQNKPIVIWLQV